MVNSSAFFADVHKIGILLRLVVLPEFNDFAFFSMKASKYVQRF